MSLQRFLDAQADSYDRALTEIHAGQKRSHWMWFVFPQLAALGRSDTARFYGISDALEASAFADHPILGPRLVEICGALLPHAGQNPEAILGPVDAMKLRSCATLFDTVQPGRVFDAVLAAFFDGDRDPLTLDLLHAT